MPRFSPPTATGLPRRRESRPFPGRQTESSLGYQCESANRCVCCWRDAALGITCPVTPQNGHHHHVLESAPLSDALAKQPFPSLVWPAQLGSFCQTAIFWYGLFGDTQATEQEA
jgi:hypothetical protein